MPRPLPARLPRWLTYALPGAWVALVVVCLSFTPSLLPRNGLFQGAVCGITGAIGYGLGVLGAWVWRSFADRPPRTPGPRAWRAFWVSAAVLLVVAFVLGLRWQDRLRELMDAPDPSPWLWVLMPLVAAALFVLLVAAARGLRAAYRRLSAWLGRWMGAGAARALGWAAVAVASYLVVTGLLLDGLVTAADRSFSLRDTSTPDGVEQPESGTRSGSPESLVPWDELGRQGRVFVAEGPSAAAIGEFTGGEATEPIRTYAGIAAAEDAEQRAQRAVDDLERAGGFEREYLLVATTTGTGWLDEGSVGAFEYIAAGDSAIVSMQYSYLPSWISYLVDQARAREAGRALFDAVYERWASLPDGQRPALYVFGESLGSFGGETAFSGEYDLRNRTDGALFVGPPNFNTLYREFTDGRDAGSPEVEPVFRSGRTVRFTNEVGTAVPPSQEPWNGTRVLYLQHPSDPIVWWSSDLLLSRPDWLREPRGRDVLDEMVWIPVVTFWQVTADMPLAVEVPEGHGHRYSREGVDAWATVLQPEGWTPEQADRLRELLG
jgi:uncharacterized membrane protein